MYMTKEEYAEKVPANIAELDGEQKFNSPLCRCLLRSHFLAHIDEHLRGKYRPLYEYDPNFVKHFWAVRAESEDCKQLYLSGCWWHLRPGDTLIDEDGKRLEVYAIGPIMDNSIEFRIDCRRPYEGSGYILSLCQQARVTSY